MPTPTPVLTTGSLARKLGAEIRGRADVEIRGVNSVESAREDDLTFVISPSYARQLDTSKACAVLIGAAAATHVTQQSAQRMCLLIVPDAELGMAKALELFHLGEDMPAAGVHPSAVIDPTAKLGRDVRIGAHVSIAPGCVLGDGVILHPGVRLYCDVRIGSSTTLHANVVVRQRCQIGRGVILNSNVSIGTDGFGYRFDPAAKKIVKILHVGSVIIEDDVEIGANSCIDRGKFGATVIGAGTKLDNMVQIAHNCRIGRCCMIAGQSGLSGSTVMGDGAILGGSVGVGDHVTIGAGAVVGGRSFVITDVPPGARWTGHPAGEGREVLRQWASIRKLPDLLRRLSRRFPAEPGDS